MGAAYMAVSLPDTFTYPGGGDDAALIGRCMLPVARELNIPSR
jgi:hypothetical protein